jgi:drug/metabolite transporter (DMT)-like permease
MRQHWVRTWTFTSFAMVAFAANSLLSRQALARGAIDAASFSTIRLVSGAVVLLVIASVSGLGRSSSSAVRWRSAVALFLYAVAFSFAYLSLAAGTGALILFGAVQVTMIASALVSGERPSAREWVGLTAALGGLGYLVSPGVSAPSAVGSTLMAIAGIAWGAYSVWGRGAANPLADTTANFARAVPLALVVSLLTMSSAHVSASGIWLAVTSGAVTSGVGYVIWYAALRGLTATRAATVQLSVPVLAAVGGVLFLTEAISTRLVVSAVLILGGIALAVFRPAEAGYDRGRSPARPR